MLIFVHLESNPSIYDVFKVKVGSLVVPSGPIKVHTGSQVHFKTVSGTVDPSADLKWRSSSENILRIDQSGIMTAQEEGSAKVKLEGDVHSETRVDVF